VELMPKKKSAAARYAVIGLIVAGIGCVATALLALVEGTIALKLYAPPKPALIPQWLAISAGVLVLGLALYGILNPSAVGKFLSGRQARYGSNALVMSLAFVGILLVANVLAFQNPKSWDFTEGQQHTLAKETLQALDTLPDKVSAIAFFSTQSSTDAAKQLLTEFKTSSKGKFDFRFVDPNTDPVLARQYGVTGDGKIVLVMGKQTETATYADENSLTQALIRLISPEARVVYFLTGHGEPDINGTDPGALARARATLTSKNYTVKTLNLAAENKIPDDAKAVVIAGPTHPLLDQEISQLKAYVDNGGSLIVLEDPTPFTALGSAPDPLANYLKTDWGITLDNDVVIDLTSNQPFSAISSSYSSSAPITQHMTTVTVMPQSRSLGIDKNLPQSVNVTPLILTSQQSWGETDLASLQSTQQIAFDPTTDIAGPLTLAASGENSSTRGRIVVFGSSTFATDKGFDVYANGDIFTNAVDWASQQNNLINITPRTPVTRTFEPPSQLPYIAILLGSVILIPGLIVVAGVSNWLARRRQG
jgi:gliding motility-associatede transport system auxiliary component